MPTLGELIRDHAEMDVVCDIGKIHVSYRPRVVTTAWVNSVQKNETTDAGDSVTLYQPIRDSIAEWDFEESPGVPFAMTDEVMETLPRTILNQILWSVMTTARPNQTRPPVLSTGGSLVRLTSTTTPENSSNNRPTGSD